MFLLYMYIESTNQQSWKSSLPFLSTRRSKFYGTRSCTHTQQTILFILNHPLLSTFNVKKIYSPKFTEIHLAISLMVPYKVFPVKEIIKCMSFSSSPPPPSFHRTLFIGLCMNPATNTPFIATYASFA